MRVRTTAADAVRWHAVEGGPVLAGDGLYLRVDADDSLGLCRAGAYEPYETALLLHLVTPGTTVLDVGANVGYHTVQFARAAGPDGRVIAFEPDPGNLRLLRHNVRANAFRNVEIVPKAVSDETGRLRLFRSAENGGDHRVYDSGDDRQAIDIEAVALDDLLAGYARPISLVKLDIQGAEPRAIAGMQRLLDSHPEAWVAAELWPAGLARAGSSAGALLDRLRGLGGGLLRIDERRGRLVPLDPVWLADTVTVERGNHTNVLVPRRDWASRG
ncbi:MAG: FkbM family methyltransferase [Vicinamibacterales bacterium]